MKNRVVVFYKDNARVYITLDTSEFKDVPNSVVNPDLSAVVDQPQHYWKLDNGKVVVMNKEERKMRDSVHYDTFVPAPQFIDRIKYRTPMWSYWVMTALMLALLLK